MKKFKQGARATGGRSLYVIVSIEQTIDVAEKKLESFGELGVLPRSLRLQFKPFNCVHSVTIPEGSILHHVYRVPIGSRSVSYLRDVFSSFGVSIYGHDGAKHKFGRVFYNSPNKNSHAPLHLPWAKISAEIRKRFKENETILDELCGLSGSKWERKLIACVKKRLPNLTIVNPSAMDILSLLPIVCMSAPSVPDNAINGITLRAAKLLAKNRVTPIFFSVMQEFAMMEKFCADNDGKPELEEKIPIYMELKSVYELCLEYLGKMLEREYNPPVKLPLWELREYENTQSDYVEYSASNYYWYNLPVYELYEFDYSTYRLRPSLADENFRFD